MTKAEEIRKEILKDFVTFLKKHNAYTNYRKNLADYVILGFPNKRRWNLRWRNAYTYGIKYIYHGHITLNNAYTFINSAFCWSGTLERNEFWGKLHNEWVSIVFKKYDKYEAVLNEKEEYTCTYTYA